MFKFLTKKPKANTTPRADASGITVLRLDDPRALEYIRSGELAGISTNNHALSNSALFRCVCLISQCIGMLPLNLMHNNEEREHATDNPIYSLLKRKPNNFQTAYEFKTLMQGWVLQYGNAYARIIWSMGKVKQLIPIHPQHIQVSQNDDWTMRYTYQRQDKQQIHFSNHEILHLRDFTDDGINGISRVKLAKRALNIAFDAETAASRMFTDGVMAGGALSTPNKLSDAAFANLEKSLQERHTGADNAGKFLILEEGLKAEKWSNSASDAQHIENRNHQIEEIARLFGVPRPLLMMDDTSWGSGIGELGIFFLKYGMLPWFTMWEQALSRSLLTEQEQSALTFKFNAGALLRGSLKDQAEFFAKALGSGGHGAWLTQNEVRSVSDLPKSTDPTADELRQAQQGKNNEPHTIAES